MKRSIFLVLVLTVLFAFASCNKDTKTEAAQSGPVKVIFWSSMSGELGNVQQKIVDEFNACQNEVFVEAVFQGNYYDMGAKLQAAVAANEVPHLAQVELSRIKLFADSDAIVDLKPYIAKAKIDMNDFIPALMDFSYVGDKIVALPFNRSTPMFYYNKEHFAEVGLDPDTPPATWADLKEYAKKLTIPGERWGFAVPVDSWFYEAMIMQGGAPIFNKEGTSIGFNSSVGTDPLYFWKDLVKSGYMKVPPGKEYNSWTLNRNDFSGGVVSMMFDSTGSLAGITAASDFEIGTGFLPKKERYGVPTGGANIVMMAGKPKAEEEAAWKFIEYLTSKDVVTEWAIGTGYIPCRYSSVESDEFKAHVAKEPNARTAVDQLEYADIQRPFHERYFEIYGVVLMDAIQKCMLEDDFTPEQALAEIKKGTEAILK